MRCGLQPINRRVWSLRGIKPVVVNDPRFEWFYTYGALEVAGQGDAVFLHTETVNLDFSSAFLKQVIEKDPQSVHIVVWDGAGFHQRDGNATLPPNVRLIRFPAYSPELNPIEKLWDVVKDRICNIRWPNLEAQQNAVTDALREYWTLPHKVVSLVGDGWMTLQANGIYPKIQLT